MLWGSTPSKTAAPLVQGWAVCVVIAHSESLCYLQSHVPKTFCSVVSWNPVVIRVYVNNLAITFALMFWLSGCSFKEGASQNKMCDSNVTLSVISYCDRNDRNAGISVQNKATALGPPLVQWFNCVVSWEFYPHDKMPQQHFAFPPMTDIAGHLLFYYPHPIFWRWRYAFWYAPILHPRGNPQCASIRNILFHEHGSSQLGISSLMRIET